MTQQNSLAAPTRNGGGDDPSVGAPTGQRRTRSTARTRPLWLAAPGLLAMAVVIVIPFMTAVVISFLRLDQYSLPDFLGAPFVGLENYFEAARTGGLFTSAWLSIQFAVVSTLVATPLGLLAAMSVQDRMTGRGLVRSIYLLPYVIPNFAVAILWKYLLGTNGPVNTVLTQLGFEPVNWLIGESSFWVLVFVNIWISWAFVYLLALSGLQTIQSELYESMSVDGASWWNKIRHLVLPGIAGPILLAILLSTIQHLNQFTVPFVLLGTPTPAEAEVLPINVYSTSFETFRFGLGAALSIVTLVVVMIPAVIYLRATKLQEGDR